MGNLAIGILIGFICGVFKDKLIVLAKKIIDKLKKKSINQEEVKEDDAE